MRVEDTESLAGVVQGFNVDIWGSLMREDLRPGRGVLLV